MKGLADWIQCALQQLGRNSIRACGAAVSELQDRTPQDRTMTDKLAGPPSSSSRMRVIYHNWSATKQRPHPQSVAELSHHSVLSGDRIRQCETSSGSRHKDTDQCL